MGSARGAINLRLGVVGALYKWGRKKKVIHPDCEPTKGLEPEKMGEHEPWPDHVLEAALASETARVKLATHLLFYTGQRIGDVCAMRWSDIRDGQIEIKQQKTGREMSIPIHAKLAAILEQTPRRALTIISSHDGNAILPNAIRLELQAFVKAAFKMKIVPHGLRKNAVNAILEAGCSTAETSAVTGQSLQMVEHYAKKRNQKKLASAAILTWENTK
jgi:integrase